MFVSRCRGELRTHLHVTVGLLQGFQAVREAVDVSVQLSLLFPQEVLVEVDQLQEALGSCIVVPALVLQKSLGHLIEIMFKACTGREEKEEGIFDIMHDCTVVVP